MHFQKLIYTFWYSYKPLTLWQDYKSISVIFEDIFYVWDKFSDMFNQKTFM